MKREKIKSFRYFHSFVEWRPRHRETVRRNDGNFDVRKHSLSAVSGAADQLTIPINFEYCLFVRSIGDGGDDDRFHAKRSPISLPQQIKSSESLWRRAILIFISSTKWPWPIDSISPSCNTFVDCRTASDDVSLHVSIKRWQPLYSMRQRNRRRPTGATMFSENYAIDRNQLKHAERANCKCPRPLTHSLRHAQQVIRHFVVDFYYQIAIAIDEQWNQWIQFE